VFYKKKNKKLVLIYTSSFLFELLVMALFTISSLIFFLSLVRKPSWNWDMIVFFFGHGLFCWWVRKIWL